MMTAAWQITWTDVITMGAVLVVALMVLYTFVELVTRVRHLEAEVYECENEGENE